MKETKKIGKVWLAGAGPGDAALLTVKTRQLLDEADVIVYDALVSAEILSQIPETTRLIFVGKRSGNHPVPQEQINEILVKEALDGNQVLRLKGGDPFVFGRGGEEIERLLEENIPFEVVPGITSAVAVPAYAGIPITHRDYTSSFHVITGHAKKGTESCIPYKELVDLNGTLVFLMALSALPSIVKGLLDAGMEKEMPVAVLEKGTTARQRKVVSTLEQIEKEVKEQQISAPAIIVVGRVCSLAESFAWAEKRPLGGKQILVTRPRQNSSKLAKQLRELGAHVIELPAINTKALDPNPALKEALLRFGNRAEEEWLIFTSPIGVQTFFEKLREWQIDLRSLFGTPMRRGVEIRTAAIGKTTAAEMEKHGLFADVVPEVYCAEALGKAIAKEAKKESAATIVRAAIGSKELIPPLEAKMHVVEDVPLYETNYGVHRELHDAVSELIEKGEMDAVTFTSASTVKGFVSALPNLDYSKICAVCIGEQTAQEAKKYGMQIFISKKATMGSMIETMLQEFGKER